MSVYKPARSRLWLYDFVHKGQRFHGPTGQQNKRAAEAYERRLRQTIADHGPSAVQPTSDTPARDLTIDAAAGKWWAEKGRLLDSADDQERHIAHWVKLLGADKKLGAIRLSTLRTAIAKRRAIPYRKKLPSDTTINRFVAALSMVWNYVDDEDDPLPTIKWRKLKAGEDNTRVREMTDAQYDAVLAAADARASWGGLFVDVLATYGPRMGEMFTPADRLEPEALRWRIPKKRRKKNVELLITLLPHHCAALAARATRARAAGLPHLWYNDVRGRLVPVERSEADYMVRKAIAAAGLVDFTIHDMRHHALTRLLRASRNLKLVQDAAGHASIQSTVRYAHVSEDDRRKAFEGLSRNSPEALDSSTTQASEKQSKTDAQ